MTEEQDANKTESAEEATEAEAAAKKAAPKAPIDIPPSFRRQRGEVVGRPDRQGLEGGSRKGARRQVRYQPASLFAEKGARSRDS